MELFDDDEDVREWLEPFDLERFWQEVAPYALDLPPRWSCEAQIASGSINAGTVLSVLKGMAWLQIVDRLDLPARDRMPELSLH